MKEIFIKNKKYFLLGIIPAVALIAGIILILVSNSAPKTTSSATQPDEYAQMDSQVNSLTYNDLSADDISDFSLGLSDTPDTTAKDPALDNMISSISIYLNDSSIQLLQPAELNVDPQN